MISSRINPSGNGQEFVACRTKEPGVLVLSPFAGAGGMMHEVPNQYEHQRYKINKSIWRTPNLEVFQLLLKSQFGFPIGRMIDMRKLGDIYRTRRKILAFQFFQIYRTHCNGHKLDGI